jgi:cell division protein FtsB
VSLAHRTEQRRELRRLERRRRRGGAGRGPLVLQRLVQAIGDGLFAARAAVVRAVRGDRPLLVALAGVLAIAVLVLSQPAQSYLDGRARVDTLAAKAAALDDANEQLERRADDLRDPATVELLARETQGFTRPGEVPYALIPPEVDRPVITAPRDQPGVEPDAWYERLWSLVSERLGP